MIESGSAVGDADAVPMPLHYYDGIIIITTTGDYLLRSRLVSVLEHYYNYIRLRLPFPYLFPLRFRRCLSFSSLSTAALLFSFLFFLFFLFFYCNLFSSPYSPISLPGCTPSFLFPSPSPPHHLVHSFHYCACTCYRIFSPPLIQARHFINIWLGITANQTIIVTKHFSTRSNYDYFAS